MDEESPRSGHDDTLATAELFQDAVANATTRSVTPPDEDAATRAALRSANADKERWERYARHQAREKDEILDYIFDCMRENQLRARSPFLASIQTKEQFRAFLLDLLFDDIVEIAKGVFEGMQHGDTEPEGPSEAKSSGEPSAGREGKDAGESATDRGQRRHGDTSQDIPF